jgi:hypothetical protein
VSWDANASAHQAHTSGRAWVAFAQDGERPTSDTPTSNTRGPDGHSTEDAKNMCDKSVLFSFFGKFIESDPELKVVKRIQKDEWVGYWVQKQ